MESVFESLVIGSDHGGYCLKEELKVYMTKMNISFVDHGSYSKETVDYPDYATLVCEAILKEKSLGGLLICGTGIGISMAANRYQGIRAAVCNDGVTSASLARRHNNANILCLGGRLIGIEVAQDCLKTFLSTPFDDHERHRRRLNKLE